MLPSRSWTTAPWPLSVHHSTSIVSVQIGDGCPTGGRWSDAYGNPSGPTNRSGLPGVNWAVAATS